MARRVSIQSTTAPSDDSSLSEEPLAKRLRSDLETIVNGLIEEEDLDTGRSSSTGIFLC